MKKDKFRNLPVEESRKLSSLIDVENNQVISMSIAKGNNIQAMLLGLSAGELISDEEYFGDTLYYLIEGKVKVGYKEHDVLLNENDILMVPEHVIHQLEIEEDSKLMQITMINKENE